MEIKRNNPGNLRKSAKFAWQGEQPGIAPGQFVIFDTLAHGFRAMIKDLNTDIKQGQDNLRKLIYEFAPPSDNNPTENYISYVSRKTGIEPTRTLKHNDFDTLGKIAVAMAYFEHGIKADDGTLSKALTNAKDLLKGIKKKVISNPILTAAAVAATIYLITRK